MGSDDGLRYMRDIKQERLAELEMKLPRLLAINLGIGVLVALLLVGGLLVLDPGGLRHLIFADDSPGVALGLLLFGFVITLGSTAMGTAIMTMGGERNDGPRGGTRAVRQEAMRKAAAQATTGRRPI